MKQILQNMKTGELTVADVPPPLVKSGQLLVRTSASLISAGTEKSKIDLGKKSLLGKARERPDLVKKVIDKVKTEGLSSTFTAVKAKLDAEIPLGYSAAGIVAEVGEGVEGFKVGDRVACAGAGYASHAEMISVPKNLCVQAPDKVGFDEAAFGTLGAIALQGVRLAEPTLGEAIVVVGLGLLGQITVQLLRANGCRVFGVDTDESKFELAKTLGAEMCASPDDAANLISDWSRGRGADAVLITAATSSNEPLELAGEISRLKGRVVVVGLVGMGVPREAYYLKELSLQVSMSYGPGRYDAEYEERGHDYPFSYVRWTEGRNIEAFLDLVADGSVQIASLITHRFPIEQGEAAYKLIEGKSSEPYLGIVLQYNAEKPLEKTVSLKTESSSAASVRVGMIGAGSYARKFLLPNLKSNGVEFCSIATASGLSASDIGKQYGFESCVSNAEQVITDADTNLIVIATRHDSHASLATAALNAGKHVFVEKPLAMNDDELNSVLDAAAKSSGRLTVGFNRRFSPSARQTKEFFAERQSPLSILYRVNAGRIAKDSWIQDPTQGGGRIVGEVCHFIDLMQYLTGSITTRVFAESVGSRDSRVTDDDSIFITLRFADGSNGTIAYLAEGDKALAKERIEIFGGGRSCVIDDFRRVSMFAGGRETSKKSIGQDKGQADEIRAVCEFVKNGACAPISLDDLVATTRATFRILDSLRTGQPQDVSR
ncbi:MAG: bi-domain-containing oxidoreductase [Pyrinomonadaceae bacterium]